MRISSKHIISAFIVLFISTAAVAQEDELTHRLGIEVSPIFGLDYLSIRQGNSSESTYGNDFLPLVGMKYELRKSKLAYATFLGYEPIYFSGFSIDNEHTFKYGGEWVMGTANIGYMFRKNFRFNDHIYHNIFYAGLGVEVRLFNRFIIEPQVCYGKVFERDTGFISPKDKADYNRGWFRLNLSYLFSPLKGK